MKGTPRSPSAAINANPGATGTMYQLDFRVIQLKQANGMANIKNNAIRRLASDRHKNAAPKPTQIIIQGRTKSFIMVTRYAPYLSA